MKSLRKRIMIYFKYSDQRALDCAVLDYMSFGNDHELHVGIYVKFDLF